MKLLTTQKNQLFDLIVNNGLSPSQFEFTEGQYTKGVGETDIKYKTSDFYFYLKGPNQYNQILIKISPGLNLYEQSYLVESWSILINAFGEWIRRLKSEITTEDKWSRLENEIKNLNISYSDSDLNFTASEYEDLKIKMNLLKGRLDELSLTQEQLKSIQYKIDHLTEMAIKLGKYDWQNLFIGTIISIVIQLKVTPENAQSLWDMIKNLFSNYFIQFSN